MQAPAMASHARLGANVDLVIIFIPRDVHLDRFLRAAGAVQQKRLDTFHKRLVLAGVERGADVRVLGQGRQAERGTVGLVELQRNQN